MRKRELLRLLKDDRGLVALLWVMGFAGFLAFFAIVMESGLILAEKRNLQNSADAAALAGAQALVLSEADAINDAVTWAGKNTSGLVDNNANVFNDGVYITATVSRNAQGVFNDWLSFGRPLVTATATARLASPRLPGPGVFCIGVEFPEYEAAAAVQQALGDPLDFSPVPPDDFYTLLRTGAGAGSNAGFVDIDGGGAAQNVRQCMENGSSSVPEPTEEAQTGLATGPAAQGLQARLEGAIARGCYTWDEIRASIALWEANRMQAWQCSPFTSQATAVGLLPVLWEDFQGQQGTIPVNLYDGLGDDKPFLLAYFWLDGARTFDMSSQNWKFLSDTGQGQAEFSGVFLLEFPTTLGLPLLDGAGGFVDCDQGVSVICFLQLVD